MNTISTINVPFHGNNLCIVNHEGRPYVPMKPIVEGMGLSWEPQLRKLNQRFSKGMIKMVIPTIGGAQETVCLAMHKLTGWLFSIMPNKVKPEIRDKVIQYQEECDDVLYEYWTTGEVKAKHKSTVQERNPLKNAVNLLVSKKGIMYPEAYSLVHQQFNVSGIDELTADQIPMAVEYVHKLVMEGEYIPKQESIDTPSLSFTEEEMLSIVHMCNAANQMRQSANDMYPAFVEFGSRFTGAIYDMKCEHGFKVKNGTAILFNKLKSAGLTGRIWETTISNLERSLA